MAQPTPEQIAKSGSEHAQQAALFCQAQLHLHEFPELEWMFAIPNGGLRDKRTAAMLKAEGVRSGIADVMLPVARFVGIHWLHGMFIEMKVDDNVQSPTQKAFESFVTDGGYVYVVAYTWVEAWQYIVAYLRGYQ